MRVSRLIVAGFLIPIAAILAFTIGLEWDGDGSIIDSNGSAIGVVLVVAAVFGISRIAADEQWSERAGTALVLGSAYFLLTWVGYGDPSSSADDSPHLIWYGVCVAAFMPTVVIVPASKWAWASYRRRVPLNS